MLCIIMSEYVVVRGALQLRYLDGIDIATCIASQRGAAAPKVRAHGDRCAATTLKLSAIDDLLVMGWDSDWGGLCI